MTTTATFMNEKRTLISSNTKPENKINENQNKNIIKEKMKKKSCEPNKNPNIQIDETKTNENQFINILYTNADTMSNKFHEIETHISYYNADLVLITEYLSKNATSNFSNVYNINGFHCLENNVGRGVCIYYKKELNITVHDKINDMYRPSLFINIKTENKPLNVGLIYRSPNSDENDNKKLNKQINFATKKLKNLVMFGDFNHPNIDWDHSYCKKNEDHCDSLFLYEIVRSNLNQLISKCTHFKPKCRPSLIDLILTKNPEIVSNVTHNPPIGKSHHSVLTAKLRSNVSTTKSNKNSKEKIIKPNFDKADFLSINTFLNNINWSEELHDKDVNEMWDHIETNIKNAQDLFVPNKIINNNKINCHAVTMDTDLHSLLKNKRYYFKLYKKYKTKTFFYCYNKARNKVSSKIKQLKKNKEDKIAKNIKCNSKAFYQYIASKTINKDGVADLVNCEGKLTSNDTEKCDILNTFFSSVFTNEDASNVPDFKHDFIDLPSLDNCIISTEDMEKALFNLNQNKSPGPDHIHPKFLKLCSKSLALPLTILFNNTLKEGAIPENWKCAEVRPIFKKGDKSQPGNYRPVSLTSIVCKIMESFIKNALQKHLIDNNILSKEQFGFVSGRNTITQLLITINDWMQELDNDVPIDACYLDFRKAFDTVPHTRLINKLKSYNINGSMLNWIHSFLTDRVQFVKINNSISQCLNVTSGVPQGSVLGPTLFIYFINDLPNVVQQSKVKIFADDTKIYNGINDSNDNNCLQNTIDEMYSWTNQWLLKFNKEKCKVLHLGKSNKKHEYFIGNEGEQIKLEETDLEKDLGIHIDPNLDFKKHIKATAKKASFVYYKILKHFTYRDSNILVPLFKTLVRPILEYGNSVWSNGLKKYKDMIENVQRKFTKHIKGMRDTPYEDRLKAIKLPSLEFRQLRGDMIQVFKIANNYYDSITTKSLFNFSRDTRLRGHSLKIVKQTVNKSKYANFFTNRIVNTWNKLPNHIVNAKSINEFKNLFDEHNKDIQFKINF